MPKTILGGGRRGATLMLAAVLSAGSTLIGCDTGLLLHQGVPQDGANDGADGTFGGDGTFGDSTREGGNSPMDATGEHATMCNADQDCMGNPMGSHCDLNTQMCEPCLQNPNTCPQGQYCNAQFQCVGGCESDLDCTTFDAGTTDGGSSGGRCNVPVHQCVQCLGDLDCPSMLVCMQNTCVQGCSSSRPCPTGSDCCNGACVDLLSTTTHCGSCLHSCDMGNACCGGICYDLQSDARHCGGCGSVCSLSNATASCTAGACSVGTCAPGFGDCDGDPTNGCEAPLNDDPNHCGTCTTQCSSGAHVTSSCMAGICTTQCAPGYLHCSMNPADGCEVNPSSDPNNCGVCGNVCSGAHVTTGGCMNGACTIAGCQGGYTDCDGLASDGCEANTATDVLNCGACFHACPSGQYSMPSCSGGACSLSCLAGHGDCNMNPGDGCEATFATDANHCGTCTTVCPTPANATPSCASGACTFFCSGTFQDCDHAAGNGCEANLLTDGLNCGACGNACSAAHATATCTAGACGILSCSTGFANCNGLYSDGCETATTADILNCGSCNHTCPAASFATTTCTASTCGFACLAGHGDCDGNAANGCETDLTSTPTHCGTCGNSCTPPANATATCSGSACGFTCLPGFADCDGLPGNGCEVNLSTDSGNCGTCHAACTLPNAAAVCSMATCQIAACNSGFQDCDGIVTDGCETNVTADLNNCGACLNVCPMGQFATAMCSTSTCSIACAGGHGDCNNNADDGCEVTFATDPNHCGSCGHVCTPPANAGARCTVSTCGFTCLPGFRNCDGTNTNCAVDITNDPNNCGGCGVACVTPHATPGCSASDCTIGSCNTGFSDCDGMVSNGCETNSATDSSNCGACGHVCTGGTICVASACALVNPFPSTGAEGNFAPLTNTVITPGVHNYGTITIPAGVTVTTNGSGLLDLRATGNIMIAGTIDVSGGPGGAGVRPTGGGGGGATGAQTTAATGIPGGAGTGGVTPAGSPSNGCLVNGAGGANGGGSGSLGVSTVGGGGGGGPAGGAGGLIGSGCNGGSGGGGATAGAGGQSGGPPYDGAPGQSGVDPCQSLVAGGGGGSVGSAAAADLAMNTTFTVGSGGGGGSADYGTGLSGAEGGGGGGGGAVRLASPTQITIAATGVIRANGGVGGAGSNANATCTLQEGGAGGGGGSGGAIYLAAPTISQAGTVSAAAGGGGAAGANLTGGAGGVGGVGRIRLSVSIPSCTLTGTFNPPLQSACNLSNNAGNTYIAGYPR